MRVAFVRSALVLSPGVGEERKLPGSAPCVLQAIKEQTALRLGNLLE